MSNDNFALCRYNEEDGNWYGLDLRMKDTRLEALRQQPEFAALETRITELEARTPAAPVVAEGWKFPTFEDWLASPIESPSSPHGLSIQYAKLAFNAGRAAHPVAGSPAIEDATDDPRLQRVSFTSDGAYSTYVMELAQRWSAYTLKKEAGSPAKAEPVARISWNNAYSEWRLEMLCEPVGQDTIDLFDRPAEPMPAATLEMIAAADEFFSPEPMPASEAQPVMYQNRLIAPNGNPGRWVECDFERYELFANRDAGDGFKYEVRALYTATPVPASEAPYPYDALFRAIGDATKIEGKALAISVKQFVETLASKGYAVAPVPASEAARPKLEHDINVETLEYAMKSGAEYLRTQILEWHYANLAAPAAPTDAKADHDEAVLLLSAVFDAWENGDDCYEGGDIDGSYMGKAFQLDDDVFDRCCTLLNRLNPPRNAPTAAQSVRDALPEQSIINCEQDRAGNLRVTAFIAVDDVARLQDDPVARTILQRGADTASDWCLLMESVFHSRALIQSPSVRDAAQSTIAPGKDGV